MGLHNCDCGILHWVRGTLKSKSVIVISTNAAEFNAGSDDVFTRIAGRYDRLCDVFSLLAHRYWKATMARQIAGDRGLIVLDVASGTGDIALRVARRRDGANKLIVAGDICPAMLAIAKSKASDQGIKIDFRHLNAHELDVPDSTVDAYAISFGLKICNRTLVLKEAFRVLKPEGRIYCLEASRIPVPFIHAAYLGYMDWCLPLIARIATGGDRGAYDYLLRGIHDFPGAHLLAREIESFGFQNVSYRYMTFGIVALHVAAKPMAGRLP
jgi:demethylmenaquinone methyltransferase/2-methoxy-6-polyprenyl-1,4-benzoquinol methylase